MSIAQAADLDDEEYDDEDFIEDEDDSDALAAPPPDPELIAGTIPDLPQVRPAPVLRSLRTMPAHLHRYAAEPVAPDERIFGLTRVDHQHLSGLAWGWGAVAELWYPVTRRSAFAALEPAQVIVCDSPAEGLERLRARHPTAVLDRVFAAVMVTYGQPERLAAFVVTTVPLLILGSDRDRVPDVRPLLDPERPLLVLETARHTWGVNPIDVLRDQLAPTDYGLRARGSLEPIGKRRRHFSSREACWLYDLVYDPVRRRAVRRAQATAGRSAELGFALRHARDTMRRQRDTLRTTLEGRLVAAAAQLGRRSRQLRFAIVNSDVRPDRTPENCGSWGPILGLVAGAEDWLGPRAVRTLPEFIALKDAWRQHRRLLTARTYGAGVLTSAFGRPMEAGRPGTERVGNDAECEALEELPRALDALFHPRRRAGRLGPDDPGPPSPKPKPPKPPDASSIGA